MVYVISKTTYRPKRLLYCVHLYQDPKYVQGFRRFDKVWFDDQEWFIWGLRSSGKFCSKQLIGLK